MADVHQLPTLRNAEQEASEWIARLEADDVTSEDRARFEAWRRAHPLNSQAFADVSATWQRFVNAGPLASAAPVREAAVSVPQPGRRGWGVAIAAMVVVATLLASAYLRKAPDMTAYETAVGEQLTVPLADGSFLELNSNSRVRVDYSAAQRTLHLDRGEAFFRVAHDTRRPFWVTAGGGWVRAVGTEFDVYMRLQGLQVTVREGTVRAGESRASLATARPDEQKLQPWVTLSAGQQADLDATAARKRALTADELADVVAWRGGTVDFENRPLADVVRELNRYSAEPLILEDESLRGLLVGGVFQASPQGASSLVRMLEQNLDVQVRRDSSGIHLHSGAPRPNR
jgi:transmembrane sensor